MRRAIDWAGVLLVAYILAVFALGFWVVPWTHTNRRFWIVMRPGHRRSGSGWPSPSSWPWCSRRSS